MQGVFGCQITMLNLNHLYSCLIKIRMEFTPSPGNVCSFNFNYFLLENGSKKLNIFHGLEGPFE